MSYYIAKTIDVSFEESVQRVVEELKKEGFGVLTEIDVKATLKKKLDADFRKYTILGACNPPFAYKALEAEPLIGILLPCNVVVHETEDGKTEVAAVDPLVAMQSVESEGLRPVAEDIQAKLKRVIAGV